MPSPLDTLTQMLGLPKGFLDALYPMSLYQTVPPIMDRTPSASSSVAPQPLPTPNPFSQQLPPPIQAAQQPNLQPPMPPMGGGPAGLMPPMGGGPAGLMPPMGGGPQGGAPNTPLPPQLMMLLLQMMMQRGGLPQTNNGRR